MVFASDMPGGKGETDLWLSKREADGSWGTPAHLGDKINTERRDNYPWLDFLDFWMEKIKFIT